MPFGSVLESGGRPEQLHLVLLVSHTTHVLTLFHSPKNLLLSKPSPYPYKQQPQHQLNKHFMAPPHPLINKKRKKKKNQKKKISKPFVMANLHLLAGFEY